MASDKERIEKLEEGLGNVQDNLQRMEMGIVDKFQRLEDTFSRMSDAFLANRESSSHQHHLEGTSWGSRDNSENNRSFSSKTAKLEFPRFADEEPSKWLKSS